MHRDPAWAHTGQQTGNPYCTWAHSEPPGQAGGFAGGFSSFYLQAAEVSIALLMGNQSPHLQERPKHRKDHFLDQSLFYWSEMSFSCGFSPHQLPWGHVTSSAPTREMARKAVWWPHPPHGMLKVPADSWVSSGCCHEPCGMPVSL